VPEVIGFDHIYLAVSDLARSERFYDLVLGEVLGFRKTAFTLGGEPHRQYFNRHFGLVLRPARVAQPHQPYAPGLHHLCLRVESARDVAATARALQARAIPASDAASYPDYAPDYVATFLDDPDGVRLEVTNYRQERRDRHDRWPAGD
jgi:catechol 2,3-dioxygenase-like lactoylglutathione lyase family enzyme